MIDVRVIAAMGATVRGPAALRLTKAQHNVRNGILGPWKSKKNIPAVFEIGGDQSLTFKYGEEFGMEAPRGRLNRSLFDFAEDAEPEGELDLGGKTDSEGA